MAISRKIAVRPTITQLTGDESVTVAKSGNPFPFSAPAAEFGGDAALTAEIGARVSGDVANAAALATETSARVAGDSAEAAARSSAISAEVAARNAAISTAVAAESVSRAIADANEARARIAGVKLAIFLAAHG